MGRGARCGLHTRRLCVTAVLPPGLATAWAAWLCAALLGAVITPAASLDAAVTDNNPRVFVAPLPSILNTRTLTDYNVRRFFTQFGADPNGVWSNPIGDYIGERDDMELRNTYMYGLDVLFHRQLLQSPLRVHTSEEADVVFLPIYADIGCRLSQENEDQAKAWNQTIETFWSTFGQTYPDADRKPHFVVTGRREAENMGGCPIDGKMYNGKVDACNFLCHPYAKNLLMLTVEVYTGSLDQMGEKPLRPNSVVVPWPGHWHLHLGSRYFSAAFDKQAHMAARQYLAMESLKTLLKECEQQRLRCCIGRAAGRVHFPMHLNWLLGVVYVRPTAVSMVQVRLPLREQLFKSCTERPEQCLHYAPRGSIRQFNQSEIYDVIKSAWYCIQPPGDGPSRHATMDCLAADTMPVFFDQHLTAVMPFSDIIDYSDFTEYIDPQELQSTQANAIDVLQSGFTKEMALEKARRLHEIKHVFLYALNPVHELIRWHEAYAVHPLDDAFTSSMKALLRRSCELGMLGKCEKAETGKASSRGTAQSATPKALLRPRSDSAEAQPNKQSDSSDSSSNSTSRSSKSAVALPDSSVRGVSGNDVDGGGVETQSGTQSDPSDSINGDKEAATQEDVESDSSDRAESSIGDEAVQSDVLSRQSDIFGASEEDGVGKEAGEQQQDEEPDLELAQPKVIKAPSLSSHKGNPGSKTSKEKGHTTGGGDGSPAVKRGDSLKFPNRDEREVAAAVAADASQQALSESDQSYVGAVEATKQQASGNDTTGGGDGSPATKHGDSLHFPYRDERDVAAAEARDTAGDEEIKGKNISSDEDAR